MNFEFSEQQQLMRDQAARFLDDKCPPEVVRRVLEGSDTHDPALWQGIAELGWQAITIPEEYGGLGLSYLELCVIAEQLGRVVAPVPFASTVYLAVEILKMCGSEAQKEKWLSGIAGGDVVASIAVLEGSGWPAATALTTELGDGVLSGRKTGVADGDTADVALVLARTGASDEMVWCLADLSASSVVRTPMKTLDPTRSLTCLEFSGTPAEPIGGARGGWEIWEEVLNRAAVLFAWEQLGGAQAAFDQARAYALERIAFGRPIASYQAIKHKLVDIYVEIELARANCYYGAWALSTDAPDLPTAAAAARLAASRAYYTAAKENIHVHGGMGFTWESDCQLHYRRAKWLALIAGSERVWTDRLVDGLQKGHVGLEMAG